MLRLLLVLCALTWWVLPGMGLIDLSVTWDPEWPVMLEAGWGLLFTFGLGLPFLVTAVALGQARAALAQVYVVTVALVIGAVAGLEPQAYWIFVMLAVELPLLHVAARDTTLGDRSLSPALAGLAVVAAPAALTYAWQMAADNRRSLITSDITNDTDHFAIQAALALALVALPAVAAWWPSTRRLFGSSTALMAAYLGLVSYYWPGTDGGFGQTWSVAVMVWAGAIVAATWWPKRSQSRGLATGPAPPLRRPAAPDSSR